MVKKAAFPSTLNHDITFHLFRSSVFFNKYFVTISIKILKVPKTTLRFGDLLERYKAKGKGTWVKVQRKPGTNFKESSPGGVT